MKHRPKNKKNKIAFKNYVIEIVNIRIPLMNTVESCLLWVKIKVRAIVENLQRRLFLAKKICF